MALVAPLVQEMPVGLWLGLLEADAARAPHEHERRARLAGSLLAARVDVMREADAEDLRAVMEFVQAAHTGAGAGAGAGAEGSEEQRERARARERAREAERSKASEAEAKLTDALARVAELEGRLKRFEIPRPSFNFNRDSNSGNSGNSGNTNRASNNSNKKKLYEELLSDCSLGAHLGAAAAEILSFS